MSKLDWIKRKLQQVDMQVFCERLRIILLVVAIAIAFIFVIKNEEKETGKEDTESTVKQEEEIKYNIDKYRDIAYVAVTDNYSIKGINRYADISDELNVYNITDKYELTAAELKAINEIRAIMDDAAEEEVDITPDVTDANEPSGVFTGTLEDLERLAKGETIETKETDVETSDKKEVKDDLFEEVAIETKETSLKAIFSNGKRIVIISITGIGSEKFKIERTDN